MGSEQDRGWTIETERDFASLRGGARSFYESRATHPIYGETIPARSIDEETAYQETLARIARIENQMSNTPEMPMMEIVEADTTVQSAVETEQVAGQVQVDTPSASGS